MISRKDSSLENIILLAIYNLKQKNQLPTFEEITAEVFTKFPDIFSFKKYPQWPDSDKVSRPLRYLREKGYITGLPSTHYTITTVGEQKLDEVKNFEQDVKQTTKMKNSGTEWRIIYQHIYLNPAFKKFLENKNNLENFKINKLEFGSILLCAPDSSLDVWIKNTDYFKQIAKNYNEKDVIDFLNYCSEKFIPVENETSTEEKEYEVSYKNGYYTLYTLLKNKYKSLKKAALALNIQYYRLIHLLRKEAKVTEREKAIFCENLNKSNSDLGFEVNFN